MLKIAPGRLISLDLYVHADSTAAFIEACTAEIEPDTAREEFAWKLALQSADLILGCFARLRGNTSPVILQIAKSPRRRIRRPSDDPSSRSFGCRNREYWPRGQRDRPDNPVGNALISLQVRHSKQTGLRGALRSEIPDQRCRHNLTSRGRRPATS
jgi:hypothetical protein